MEKPQLIIDEECNLKNLFLHKIDLLFGHLLSFLLFLLPL